MEFEGEFETHITVRADDPAAVDALRVWAERRELKFHHIVLARGATPSQPMVSLRGDGTLTSELAAARSVARQLAADGFTVSRVKLEAAPDNPDVPESDEEAARLHADRYFEHHVKVALPPGADLGSLAQLAIRHGAHLSRNARRVRGDGLEERFVTQRCYSVGRPAARRRLDALVAALRERGEAIVSIEEEFVVHDSNPSVDAGWLEDGP